ncbi:odorant receptor 131-2-like [Diretmus argenteus]
MNSTKRLDDFNEAFSKNFISVAICTIINFINGGLVYTYFKSHAFQQDPRYMLYIHLVINDMMMLTLCVALQVLSYTLHLGFTPCCMILVVVITINNTNPLNLAGMAVERYIAVCRPLRHAQICTAPRTYRLIGLMWGVSAIPALSDIIIILATQPLSIFSTTVICQSSMVYFTPHHKVKGIIIQVLVIVFVFLTIIITYIRVFLAARAASTKDQASARKACNTILLHGVQLLICMSSVFVPIINFILFRALPTQRTKIFFSTFLLMNVFPRLLSLLIYGIRDPKFSSHMRLHFCCRCCSSGAKKVKPMSRVGKRSKQLALV